MNDIPNLMGLAFEQIAKEYLIRKVKKESYPSFPLTLGNGGVIVR